MKFSSVCFLFHCFSVFSQENYEIQVYASPTMVKGMTIFELHSNFTFKGEKLSIDGVRPSHHAFHETVEITHGITENFEMGFYIFTNYSANYGFHFVGTHIRPRISAPAYWKLPVGLSLSAELGYQRKEYSSEWWNVEIRPIIDKQFGRLYLSLNPTLGVQLKGVQAQTAPGFAPNFKAAFAVSFKVSLGTEYYGDLGPMDDFDPISSQSHALFAIMDLFVDPKWEINFGPGFGLTSATDRLVFKLLLGRRVQRKKNKEVSFVHRIPYP